MLQKLQNVAKRASFSGSKCLYVCFWRFCCAYRCGTQYNVRKLHGIARNLSSCKICKNCKSSGSKINLQKLQKMQYVSYTYTNAQAWTFTRHTRKHGAQAAEVGRFCKFCKLQLFCKLAVLKLQIFCKFCKFCKFCNLLSGPCFTYSKSSERSTPRAYLRFVLSLHTGTHLS